jgi:superfamily II DNA or RNA helicase
MAQPHQGRSSANLFWGVRSDSFQAAIRWFSVERRCRSFGDLQARLVSEAHRIRLAHLFDPVLAVHTSVVEPLPHQITAVYESMLPRQPLRFLLADDPGAGKTIMAGLLIKELIARGDLQRCLVVCPGSLAEQSQDELYRRFHREGGQAEGSRCGDA